MLKEVIKLVSTGGHEINIDSRCLIVEGENFLTFEFEMNWQLHCEKCEDCRALLNAIISNEIVDRIDVINWYAFWNGKFRLIDFFKFGNWIDPESGLLQFEFRSSDYIERSGTGYVNQTRSINTTRLRLILLPEDPNELIPEILISKIYDNKKRCNYLETSLRRN